MINTRVVQGIIPPGGWHLPIPEKQTRINAPDFPRLVEMVAEYRTNNLMPLGDPVADIENYICSNWPHMCHNAGPRASVKVQVIELPKPKASGEPTLIDRIIAWFDRQSATVSMDNIVLDPEARRRADICASCQFNVKWKTGCGQCNDNIDRLSNIVRMGRRLLRNPKLKACRLTGAELRAAVWLRRERILVDDPRLPDYCWAKKNSSNS